MNTNLYQKAIDVIADNQGIFKNTDNDLTQYLIVPIDDNRVDLYFKEDAFEEDSLCDQITCYEKEFKDSEYINYFQLFKDLTYDELVKRAFSYNDLKRMFGIKYFDDCKDQIIDGWFQNKINKWNLKYGFSVVK